MQRKELDMNRFVKATEFGSLMGKSAGLFWKKLDRPVGIKSRWGPHNSVTEMRLDAERTMEPRLLTRLFSSPEKDYDHMFSAIKRDEEGGQQENPALATPEGRAMLASYMLPQWYPDRYKQEGDSPIGGEDIFEDAVYPVEPRLKKAASFGTMMGKRAVLDPRAANALGLGAAGMAGGGLLGALLGYESPGDALDYAGKPQVEFDPDTKAPTYNSDGSFKTKKKSRLRSTIEGGLGGAFLGGAGGAAVGAGGTELMRISPKLQNWLVGSQLKDESKIPIDFLDKLKNEGISSMVGNANRNYDSLGSDKHFEFMRKGMPEDGVSQIINPVNSKPIDFLTRRVSPNWRLNPNPGEVMPIDSMINKLGPTVMDNPFSRGANGVADWLSGSGKK